MIKKEWLNKEYSQRDLKKFERSNDVFLTTTRFDNHTYYENMKARMALKINCLYSNPYKLCNKIPKNNTVYVLELNNSENKIMGIGKITNNLLPVRYSIYGEDYYNNWCFIGNAHISKDKMNEEERKVIDSLEKICFYGRNHLKRGSSMTCFPCKVLFACHENNFNILNYIKNMFLRREITSVIVR